MEKVEWNSIDEKQNGLEQSKNDKSSTLPSMLSYISYIYTNLIIV